jgi:anti-sigma factor RsiW
MHLDSATLIAYRDGELDPRRVKTVESHLASCGRCRKEENQMAAELALFLSLGVPAESADGARFEESLEKMLAGIHKWRTENPQNGLGGAELERLITAQLSEYLGARAAAGVRHGESSEAGKGSGVLPAAEPLLAAFLGRRAAAALTSQLLEGLALERGLAPELLP